MHRAVYDCTKNYVKKYFIILTLNAQLRHNFTLSIQHFECKSVPVCALYFKHKHPLLILHRHNNKLLKFLFDNLNQIISTLLRLQFMLNFLKYQQFSTLIKSQMRYLLRNFSVWCIFLAAAKFLVKISHNFLISPILTNAPYNAVLSSIQIHSIFCDF